MKCHVAYLSQGLSPSLLLPYLLQSSREPDPHPQMDQREVSCVPLVSKRLVCPPWALVAAALIPSFPLSLDKQLHYVHVSLLKKVHSQEFSLSHRLEITAV